ncbi:hypothetical protein [uncultured Algibacter sp.]|uniref:hypothetical protein n=1 Tax=uncultured Algibacter sp. TaxID=298659 RepID=UPI00261C7C51|nr:hypothetical protein [uncultured Algibacter sp.]
MRFLILVLFLGFGFLVNAQNISFNGVSYEIKKDRIFKDSVDITDNLSVEDKQGIRTSFNKKATQIKAAEDAQKRIEKAKKDQLKAEKRQKKAEKALKKRQKAQSKFDKSTKKHKKAIKKYEKLKGQGKLSPEDEEKWLEKIERYKQTSAKAKKKLA